MSRPPTVDLTPEIIQKWQETVNLLAEIMRVPAALVVRADPAMLVTVAASTSEGNPYRPGAGVPIEPGFYCEAVIHAREELLVSDASKDDRWKSNPDANSGLISCLGLPLLWPDGAIFGALCVMDRKANGYSDAFRKLLAHFRGALESDLRWLVSTGEWQTSARLLQAVADGTIDAMFVKDREGRYMFFNKAATRFAGKPLADVLGKDAAAIFTPESARIIMARDKRVMQSGKSETEEEHLVAGGIARTFLATRAPFRDEQGNIIGVIGVSRDITDHLKNEEALREFSKRAAAEAAVRQLNEELEMRVEQRTAQLEAANKELEAFSYSVSHDLRAPLRHVRSYVEMLHRAIAAQLTGKPLRYLKNIADASDEMAQLIDDLLAFSRMGRAEMSRGVVHLDNLVRDTIRGMEVAIQDRHIVWKIASLPPVIGDASMLKQVLSNLIDNAVKYTRPRDPAEIEIGCAGEENGQTLFFVRDNGVGFDMQYAAKLFGVFQRLHRPEEFEGTGIGLATVKRILARHGGEVRSESAPDCGATFYFTLSPSPPGSPVGPPSLKPQTHEPCETHPPC